MPSDLRSPTNLKEHIADSNSHLPHPPLSLDISSAFLQGNEIQCDLYILPPKDIRIEGVIRKLKRCIYGLNDAPRAWYDKVRAEMILLGASVN